jgi:membrane protein involved in colicin uptake
MAKIVLEFDSTDPNAKAILAAFVGGTSQPSVGAQAKTTTKPAQVEEEVEVEEEEVEEEEEIDDEAEKKAAAAAKRKAALVKKKAADAKAEAAAADAEEKAAQDIRDADDAGLGDEEEDDTPSGPTREDVRAALKKYAKLEGQPAAVQLLKDAGAVTMGELEEAKFQEVIDAASVD